MTYHPFSTPNRRIPFVNAVAQCEKCKQTSSFDALDAYEGKSLTCESGRDPRHPQQPPCGGRLKLYGEVPSGPNS